MTRTLRMTRALSIIIVPLTVFFAGLSFASDTSGAMSPDNLRKRASEKYSALLNGISIVMTDRDVFWQIGMAADPMIDYCQKTGSKEKCVELGEKLLAAFNEKVNNGIQWWWDDLGWHGHPFVRLYEITKDEKYLNAANLCFTKMLAAKRAYDICTDPAKKNIEPKYSNGCFNSYVLAGDGDQNKGIENTVTNAQFLRLALALFNTAYNLYTENAKDIFHNREENRVIGERAKVYWAEAMEQLKWFSDWFKDGLLNDSFFGTNHMLVEERVKRYKNGQEIPNSATNRYWLGDQGLVLWDYSFLHNIRKELSTNNPLALDLSIFDKDMESIAVGIAKGVKLLMHDDHWLLIPCQKAPGDDFPYGDDSDYSTGPAVYFSAMVNSARVNEKLKTKFRGDAYNFIIQNNALQAQQRTDDVSGKNAFITVANDLAALNAAIEFYH
ncbi:MAG TPA: hypothetical protein VEL47_03130 [Myxococcota bacterium]|nr:hypothetical protein [Myxococcota bacterium]